MSDESVDICFDGHRVWSINVSCRVGEQVRLEWPVNLRAELVGLTELTVVRASSGEVLASGTVSFAGSDVRLQVADSRGRWLAVNKWGNLGVPLESQKKGARKRLLRHAHDLIAELNHLGFRPFLSSGSLLGAIRNGSFLPHDDDIDLGNVTDAQHPAALVIESERLERALVSLGYIVVRHSHAHLQIIYLHKSGDLDHYIDVFTAFFDPDGTFNQPFSIRGALQPEALEPFSMIRLEGNAFPAPGQPEKWLELNYGPGWRVPDPGYSFDIPESTRRRFDSWFGTFNLHRDFWEARHTDARLGTSPDFAFVEEALAEASADGLVLEIGGGMSGTASALRAQGRSVTVADYSLPALFAQSHVAGASADNAVYLNLNDRHRVMEFALQLISAGRHTSLVLEHVLEGLGAEGKQNALLLMRWLLTQGDVAVVTLDTDLPADHTFQDPTSWHMPAEDLVAMASSMGLHARVAFLGTRRDDRGRTRTAAHAIVRRDEGKS